MFKKATLFIGFCLLISIFGPAAHAQTTINAADCDPTSVNNAWNKMSSGAYIIAIPSGTCVWTSGLTLTVPSGVTSVVFQGNTTVNCTGTAGQSSWGCSAADNTLIEDGVTGNSPIITISTNVAFEFTGISLQGPASSGNSTYNGELQFNGSTQSLRIDHNHIEENTSYCNNSMVQLNYGSVFAGVADHNLWDLCNNSSVGNGIRDFAPVGDNIGNGDGGWATATQWGSSNEFYVESNVFNGSAPNDCDFAARMVMRYNTINSAFLGVQTHGTKTDAGGYRGCRQIEIYHNYFTGPSGSPAYQAVSMKGGSGLIWGNAVAQGYNVFEYSTDRNGITMDEVATPNGWGYCGTVESGTGSNWDRNTNTSTGYPCLDGVGRGYDPQALNGMGFPNRLNSVTGTTAWPQQYLEPIYAFDNAVYSGFNEFVTGDHSTTQNIDAYVDNPSFNGTSGTGYGLLANRPSTCTPGPGGTNYGSPTGSYGVAYWATDANSGNGELYVCTATNSWTAIYTPYTYPHPLDGGTQPSSSSNAPQPPTGLLATVQ